MLTDHWAKSSFSFANGNCVEACWRKSGYSNPDGNCTEVANDTSAVRVRDTKNNGTGPELAFSPDAWQRFTRRLKG